VLILSARVELPEPFPNWRFYRFILADGQVHQIRDEIRYALQLEDYVTRFLPTDVYHSVAYYTDPTCVGFNDFRRKKAGYQNAYNLLIGGDLVFDIDARSRHLDDALSDARTCHDWLSEKGYQPRVIFSGRGFHVRVSHHDLVLKEDLPKERLKEYRLSREPLTKEIQRMGVTIDEEVTLNPKSLIRLIGSVHGTTGYKVTPIRNLEKFDLSKVERASTYATRRSATSETRNDVRGEKQREDSQTGHRLSDPVDAPILFPYVGTRVVGTANRQVLLLRFPKETPILTIRRKLETLHLKEPMAPFVIFESLGFDQAYYVLSPSAVEQEHIPRLLSDFPEARAAYVRFGFRMLPLPLHYVETVGVERPSVVVSRSHCNLLQALCKKSPHGVVCGNTLLRIGFGKCPG